MTSIETNKGKVSKNLAFLRTHKVNDRELSNEDIISISNALHLKLSSLSELLNDISLNCAIDYSILKLKKTGYSEGVSEWDDNGTSVKQVEYFRKGGEYPFFGFVSVEAPNNGTSFCILTVEQDNRYSIIVIENQGEEVSVGHNFVLPWNE